MSAPTTDAQIDVVTLTPAALAKFQGLLDSKPDVNGIRLGAFDGGCAGLKYDMTPADAPKEGEMTQVISGIPFYINPMVIQVLQGMTIDFSDALIDGGFKFINPNATDTCSCGTSFGV